MNIIISGYGKMGKAIEAVALRRDHTVLARFDRAEDWEALPALADREAVVIDFSQPAVVRDNILRCFEHRVPVVVGTTGWNELMPALIEMCRQQGQAMLTASNFSIGMNLFFALNSHLARLMDGQDGFDVSMKEIHHAHKLDKPSGTAITLAEQIVRDCKRKTGWIPGKAKEPNRLGIESVREGEVFGVHEVCWESDADSILIRHEARNRQGFALGAVMAAEWLNGKTGFFQMKDFLGI